MLVTAYFEMMTNTEYRKLPLLPTAIVIFSVIPIGLI